ncbi:hypothetical protein CPAR01_01819 [Colletotrichum paranaense]|uniref:Uncharacterized protein n=4 Tax=Colletotrichum acutatum species complex TaxID=2707335 RepID=A0AAI9UAC7_9PEZI|nr:uncharacterized protein CPAR01_01819 [Colletotrichum paranaense]XP_060376232.1 uncharacterized protein CTAM01_13178 [Colletotrichum tamarilloi]KAI3538643.1 hypothetical protein CSPX01_09387 [Colletotrichum filicis]KAK1454685.1 hypothetical protein CMEL01_03445 [Colletotrichum melonis]KAK1462479.1 hypothetical protein CCUS01_08666 [Colletotrichum cuscutae]KAK1483953.1 hypothetical protein CTAM01_13178 [Colletotrichum tamarilloi]KAK1547852.1 hypothetical protein CPAR01_01819 [Colletotrichum 
MHDLGPIQMPVHISEVIPASSSAAPETAIRVTMKRRSLKCRTCQFVQRHGLR